MTELRFSDRAVVVTGAGRGLGRAYAMELAARGAGVVVADYGVSPDGSGSSAQPCEAVAEEITAAGGRAVACHASVAERAGAQAMVDTALDAFGRIDAVVNNAGIYDPCDFVELSVERLQTMLDVHVGGTLQVTQAAWPHFARAGYGRVVNTVSEAMFGGILGTASYGTAKGAVFMLTRSLATEGAAIGIKVNAVAPRAHTRLTDAQMARFADRMPPDAVDAFNASIPAELCSPAVTFLAHESCALTGEVLQCGQGEVARIAVVIGKGIASPVLTAEMIAERIDTIMDLSAPTVPGTQPVL